jgi:hypothetical protein
MRRLAPMLAILLILAAGPATTDMFFAGADCTLIQGRWICSWDAPDAVAWDVFRAAVKGKI